MTREEAVDIIKCLAWHTRPNEEDIEQAIKALEQEPNTVIATGEGAYYKIKALQAQADTIPREAVKDVSYDGGDNWWVKNMREQIKAQTDGNLISKNNAITSVCQWGTTLERTGTYTITVAEMKQTITDMLCELPTVAIPPEHDGCKDCRWQSQSETEMPCKQCMHNYTDEWERAKIGHWFVDERPESDREVICSNCEKPIFKYHKLDFDYRPNYCPNCGCPMEIER